MVQSDIFADDDEVYLEDGTPIPIVQAQEVLARPGRGDDCTISSFRPTSQDPVSEGQDRLLRTTSTATVIETSSCGESYNAPPPHRSEHDEEEETDGGETEQLLGAGEVATDDEIRQRAVVARGAGVACGVVGCLICGPIFAIMVGLGSAYAAQYHNGGWGDAARATGEIALLTRDKAVEIDQQHHVAERTHQAFQNGWQKLQEWNREYSIVDRSVQGLERLGRAMVDFSQRHRLIERTLEFCESGFAWFLEKTSSGGSETSGHTSYPHNPEGPFIVVQDEACQPQR